jgi:SAM-dependent methyltransferase
MAGNRFCEETGPDAKRSAPAALRNREPIAEVLRDWLPDTGVVLEVASGTGEHSALFAERFPNLEWQPSDLSPDAIASIRAWSALTVLPNLRSPIEVDASRPAWPIRSADAVLNINMIHISPWSAALGLLDGAARLLAPGAPLILYGPWITDRFPTAPSNLAFDADLKRRNPDWGLRKVEDFAREASRRGFEFVDQRQMPANNLMLLFRRLA